MSSEKLLTIAIPTYNRAELALDTVRQLQRQPRIGDCVLMVVDNSSSESVQKLFESLEPRIAAKVVFHRNVSNVGLGANILRCMELATTEWLWVLADDDDIADNAIDHIFDACQESQDLDYVLFAQSDGQNGGIRTRSALEFFNGVDSWARLGFLSTGVYRTARVQHLISTGSNYVYSLFPFLAMVVQGFESNGWTGALDKRVLVHPAHKAENTWALMSSINGYVVAELAQDQKVAERLLVLAKGWCLGPVGLLHDFALRRRTGGVGLSRMAFRHKLFLIGCASMSLRIQATICLALGYLPPSAILFLVDNLRRLTGKEVHRGRGGETVFGQI